MEREFVKRMVKKDGSQRISFFCDVNAENPRDMTDEPLHCEDWSRDYSIMDKHERETKSENAASLIRYLLQRYGDNKKIIALLKSNYKKDKHEAYENGLSYDRSRKEWIVWSWHPMWKAYDGTVYESHWAEEFAFCVSLYDVDIYNLADVLSDEQVSNLCRPEYWTDGVKIASYSFGYYGDVSFDDDFDTDSKGLCWLEKDEFLKYSGCSEEQWKGKTLREIEWLTDELEAWSHNEVYGFVVEKRTDYFITKTCRTESKPMETYDETEWDETDSCWGFYGELDKVEDDMFENAGLNKDDFAA